VVEVLVDTVVVEVLDVLDVSVEVVDVEDVNVVVEVEVVLDVSVEVDDVEDVSDVVLVVVVEGHGGQVGMPAVPEHPMPMVQRTKEKVREHTDTMMC
jgi:hypothetical protein